MLRAFVWMVGSWCLASVAVAADVDFVRDVRPILQANCYKCHGPDEHKSGLRLDIRSEVFRGGDVFGASIIPGDADASPLIRFVRDDDADVRMPPEGERLSAREIDVLVAWVEGGASWPAGVDLAVAPNRRDHWSFKPVEQPDVPQPRDDTWSRRALDAFILSKLEDEGLRPAPQAEPGLCDRGVQSGHALRPVHS